MMKMMFLSTWLSSFNTLLLRNPNKLILQSSLVVAIVYYGYVRFGVVGNSGQQICFIARFNGVDDQRHN
ncbi:hypothetical protein YC2023_119700 [Brassica napus]